MNRFNFALQFILFVITINLATMPLTANAKLNRVKEVAVGVWRGSQPQKSEDFDQLEKMGIKVIINIQRAEDKKVGPEAEIAEERGIVFIQIPIDANKTPPDENIERILVELQRPENQPVYLHCTLGRDRTGLVFALYRVRVQGWIPALAYKEWFDMGFSRFQLTKLFDYFKKNTGLTDEQAKAAEAQKDELESLGGPCDDLINF